MIREGTSGPAGVGGAVEIRDVGQSDLDAVARLHLAAFPDSALGRLGVEAVKRNYHWQLNGPHDLTAVVAVDPAHPDQVLGFLFGGHFRGSTIGFVKREKWFLIGQLARHPAMLVRSGVWTRITLAVRLLLRRSSPPVAENPAAVPRRSFGVLAIAVSPDAQGRGVGGALMGAADSAARQASYVAMHLTVHPDNLGAVAFYRRLGWVDKPEPDGRWVGRMTYALDDAAP